MKRMLSVMIAICMTVMIPFSIIYASESDFHGDGSIAYVVIALGDMSYNDSGERGMNILREAGYQVKTIETGTDSSKYLDILYDLVDTGYDYIIANNSCQDAVETVAKEYPDTKFIVFDANPDVNIAADNIFYLYFKANESSYLGGIVAAGLSKSGVIGAIGGIENPVIKDFITGYVAGALSYDPDIKISVGWIGNWSNTAKMKEVCNTQNASAGVDIFFPIAGSAGTGAFEAASDLDNVWALGVDSDQYDAFAKSNESISKVIVTSVVKEVGNTLVSLFRDPSAIPWGTLKAVGIAEGAVGLAENEHYKKLVPEEIRERVEQAEKDIMEGKLIVASYFDGTESDYQKKIDAVVP